MKSGPYSLATDGSNDSSIAKMFPLSVTIYDGERTRTQLLDMCMGESSTAEGMKQIVLLT